MEIIKDKINNQVVISLSGRIDSHSAEAFEEELMKVIEAGTKTFVVDFLKVQFISSAGLRVLLLAAKKVKPLSGSVVLCNMSKEVREVFDISGFSSLFKIFSTVSEATKNM